VSGHSKWAGIKHKKAIVDAKRGKIFTQIANMITIAAKEGGSDVSSNFRLRLALEKARAANMPSVNIERAIKRGTGESGGAQIEEIKYEGYGPEGVAFLIEAATDNKNRTLGEVRNVLTKHGGQMAEAGAVSWIFDQKGQIVVMNPNEEAALTAIDAGATDVIEEDGSTYIYSDILSLNKIRQALEEAGAKIESVEIIYKPKNDIKIADKEKAKKILNLLDALESLDDVSSVYANFDIPEAILREMT